MYENYLKEYREYYGLSTSAFAEKLEVNQPTYFRYETGQNQLNYAILQKLIALGINLNYLFTGTGPMFMPEFCKNTYKKCNNEEKIKNLETFHKRFNKLQADNNLNDCQIHNANERLKEVRNAYELSGYAFAKFLNIPQPSYLRYEAGETKIGNSLLNELAKNNVNLNYLFTGTGPMFMPEFCKNTYKKCNNEEKIKNLETFHKRFNKLQADNNLNDYQMSKETGILESRVEKLGIGKAMPTFEELNAIKSHFDVSIDELLYGDIPCKSTQSNKITLSTKDIKALSEIVKKLNIS